MRNLQRPRWLTAALAVLSLGLSGCPTATRPLARDANAFSAATVLVVHGASDAYTKANELHDRAQLGLAVLDYDKKPAWNPNDYVKPLLTSEQLNARLHILNGLKSYAQRVADLASGGKQTDLDNAAQEVGTNLQDLSKNIPEALSTSIPGAGPISDTTRDVLSTALVALGRFLQERKVATSLPAVIEENDKNVTELCSYLQSDISILRRQADVDYGRVILSEDQYIRHEGNDLTPTERRAEIQKLPQYVLEQRQNDELLAKLDRTIHKLAETHHAFAAAAQNHNTESLRQYILDLSAEGQSLADYYQSLPSASAR
jgi:hypothetical protein